jgi:hypothetical protein
MAGFSYGSVPQRIGKSAGGIISRVRKAAPVTKKKPKQEKKK